MLDCSYAAEGLTPAEGNKRRLALRERLRQLIALAAQNQAALICAGNLFDLSRVTLETITFILAEFEAADETGIFITPGEKDPVLPHSPYLSRVWPANVHIFKAGTWESVRLEPNAVVVGRAWTSEPPPEAKLPPLDAPGQIIVAASWLTPAAELTLPETYTYGAFGYDGRSGRPAGSPSQTVYATAPDPHGFDDRFPGRVFEVALSQQMCDLTEHQFREVAFTRHTLDCAGFDAPESAPVALTPPPPEVQGAWYPEIRMQGACDPAFASAVKGVLTSMPAAQCQIDDRTIPLPPEHSDAPDTILDALLTSVAREIADAADIGQTRMLARAQVLGVAACTAAPHLHAAADGRDS